MALFGVLHLGVITVSKLKDGDEPHARKTKILRDKMSYIIELQKPENNNAKTGAPNFYKVSKQTGIDRVQLMKWWEKKDEILAAKGKQHRRRLPTKINKAAHKEMESELDEWMKAQRERGCLLSSFTIKVKAVEIEREICSKNGTEFKFLASEGWFRNYLKRKGYSLRRITTTGRDLPTDCIQTINKWLSDCANLFQVNK